MCSPQFCMASTQHCIFVDQRLSRKPITPFTPVQLSVSLKLLVGDAGPCCPCPILLTRKVKALGCHSSSSTRVCCACINICTKRSKGHSIINHHLMNHEPFSWHLHGQMDMLQCYIGVQGDYHSISPANIIPSATLNWRCELCTFHHASLTYTASCVVLVYVSRLRAEACMACCGCSRGILGGHTLAATYSS